MRTFIRNLFFGGLMFAAAGIFAPAGFAGETGDFYTQVNIWYEKPDNIKSTNYHKGVMIPAGTQVEVLKSGKNIQFKDKLSGMIFKIEKVKKFTNVSNEELFSRYFSKENILDSNKYRSFSAAEKEAVKMGKIEKGMSRDAVIVAYGYPPTHRTPFLEQESWTYWDSRLINFMILFRDNKVVSKGNSPAALAANAQ